MLRALPLWCVALLPVALFALFPGCGGGAGGKAGTPADDDLTVVYFSHNGRTDVYRNQRIEVRFSAPVNPDSMSNRTFRILKGPDNDLPETGAIIADGNRIFFDPTFSQNTHDLGGEGATRDQPFGFDALTTYRLYIPGPPALRTLRNLADKNIVDEYFTTFTTSDLFQPEAQPVQPVFVGVRDENGIPTDQLGFLPEAYRDAKTDAAGDPLYDTFGEIVVPFDAEIVIEFSEPIDPVSMIPGETVVVTNMTPPGTNVGILPVPGTLSWSKDGTRYFFKPAFSYGSGIRIISGVTYTTGYQIQVSLTQDITDLAGHKLRRPVSRSFRTEVNPNAKTIGFITETFSTNTFEDPATTGEWNGTVEDELTGGDITTQTRTIDYTPGIAGPNVVGFPISGWWAALVNYPLVSSQTVTGANGQVVCVARPNGLRYQQSFVPGDDTDGNPIELGSTAAAITLIEWGPDSNSIFSATHPNIEIRLGHINSPTLSLSPMDSNFSNSNIPLPSYDGAYSLPQRAFFDPTDATNQNGYWPYPTLTTPFDYDGESALIFELRVTGAATCQTNRVSWSATWPGTRRLAAATNRNGNADDMTGGVNFPPETVFDTQFTLRRRVTMALSRWYNADTDNPIFGDPILIPQTQSGGATLIVEYQGADGDAVGGGNYNPRPGTEEPGLDEWTTELQTLNGKRMIRFRVTLNANLNSDTVPRLTTLQLPYEFPVQ